LFVVAQPVVYFDFRLSSAVAIALLQHAGEFFGFSAQASEIIVGEFAPLLPHQTLDLMPPAV